MIPLLFVSSHVVPLLKEWMAVPDSTVVASSHAVPLLKEWMEVHDSTVVC